MATFKEMVLTQIEAKFRAIAWGKSGQTERRWAQVLNSLSPTELRIIHNSHVLQMRIEVIAKSVRLDEISLRMNSLRSIARSTDQKLRNGEQTAALIAKQERSRNILNEAKQIREKLYQAARYEKQVASVAKSATGTKQNPPDIVKREKELSYTAQKLISDFRKKAYQAATTTTRNELATQRAASAPSLTVYDRSAIAQAERSMRDLAARLFQPNRKAVNISPVKPMKDDRDLGDSLDQKKWLSMNFIERLEYHRQMVESGVTKAQLDFANTTLPKSWGMKRKFKELKKHIYKVAALMEYMPAHMIPELKTKGWGKYAGLPLDQLPAHYLDRLWSNPKLFNRLPGRTQKALEWYIKQPSTQQRLREQVGTDPWERRNYGGSGSYEHEVHYDQGHKRGTKYHISKDSRGDFGTSDSWRQPETYGHRSGIRTGGEYSSLRSGAGFLYFHTTENQDRVFGKPDYTGADEGFRRREYTREPREWDPEARDSRESADFQRHFKASFYGLRTTPLLPGQSKHLPYVPPPFRPKVRALWQEARKSVIEDEYTDILLEKHMNPRESKDITLDEATERQDRRGKQITSRDYGGDEALMAKEFGKSDEQFGNDNSLTREGKRGRVHDLIGSFDEIQTREDLQNWRDTADDQLPWNWRSKIPGLAEKELMKMNALAGSGVNPT